MCVYYTVKLEIQVWLCLQVAAEFSAKIPLYITVTS